MKPYAKRLICFIVMCSLMLCAVLPVSALTRYHDELTPSDWAKEAVYTLEHYGYIPPFSHDGTNFLRSFKLNFFRYYVIEIMVNMYENKTGVTVELPAQNPDVPSLGVTGDKAYSIGLIKNNSVFDHRYGFITRQEMATMIYRLAGLLSDSMPTAPPIDFWDNNEIADWAVAFVSSTGLINGISPGIFAPNQILTQEMIYAIFHRFALSYNVYQRLSDDIIANVSFVPKKHTSGTLEYLYSNISSSEKSAIKNVVSLLGDYYDMDISSNNIPEYKNSSIVVNSIEGDFELYLSTPGIVSSLIIPRQDYEKYRPALEQLISISGYKGEGVGGYIEYLETDDGYERMLHKVPYKYYSACIEAIDEMLDCAITDDNNYHYTWYNPNNMDEFITLSVYSDKKYDYISIGIYNYYLG